MTKRITLAVSGSISAYKAADLTSQLTKKGYEVTVLMTQAATAFITPLTLQVLSKNPVHLDVMAEHDVKIVNHIELAKATDLFVLAPASANTIAHLAYGFADNMVTSVALALPEATPKLIAPAMNTNMYLNPITQGNIKRLADLGFREIPPKTALLACGDRGPGALADIDDMVTAISQQLAR
ncbi:phosphopantothenoylcysteine decarboxylase [Streptococcus equi]|uniref:Phosphopantothenoylcysteine decarboxylase n=2 Tax=Streptococcus equi TaxID=1336 RepID=C0M9N1_STRE4|nr:phosphopantothenoylcysteine decarboxylase [Streptococcus equi]HEK9097264.1 phosphopantothenoylcysteine decarboxylase [Streptococcus equi subsp. zooepidemicus]ASB96704.1 phosphopantothenoylcysteine decarboxylase [Streptococcus equi subsp. equi]MBT1195860.1 phosphopantothenoylcysteine decarboxylase [Streptococcus equi subsp. equi]MBT1196299.1 phosphopantothenoylcysteine decarboxylase [Streptococcus equi subsp. equi]MBT1198991.1 phosphopantothenoylcysteine decarboxylase [Streptococcus equi sub